MFTSISTYIWGENQEENPSLPAPRPASPVGEDWVVVGNQPAPGNLGALDPLPSLTPSSTSSEAGDEVQDDLRQAEDIALGHDHPRIPVRARQENSVGLKHLRSAQISKQKNSGKALSSKALKRSNKAVMSSRKEGSKYNMPIKSAGMNKNLKQC
jgi:hypothetical protein